MVGDQRCYVPSHNSDLYRMYTLLSRIKDGLDPLRTRFEQHVKRAGLSTIEKISEDENLASGDRRTVVDC